MKKIMIAFLFVVTGSFVFAQEARFIEVNGTVEIREANSKEWQSAEVGGILTKNMVISTGIKSSAIIAVGESSKLTVRPLTVVALDELLRNGNTEEAVLNLRTGRVRADVTPPSGVKADFTVRSPTTTASVQGTSFEFNGRRLSVDSGKVRFSSQNGQRVYVAAGQRSSADSRHQQRLASPFAEEQSQVNAELSELTNTCSEGESPQLGTVGIRLHFVFNNDNFPFKW